MRSFWWYAVSNQVHSDHEINNFNEYVHLSDAIFINHILLSVNPGAKERLVQITGANEESIKLV